MHVLEKNRYFHVDIVINRMQINEIRRLNFTEIFCIQIQPLCELQTNVIEKRLEYVVRIIFTDLENRSIE